MFLYTGGDQMMRRKEGFTPTVSADIVADIIEYLVFLTKSSLAKEATTVLVIEGRITEKEALALLSGEFSCADGEQKIKERVALLRLLGSSQKLAIQALLAGVGNPLLVHIAYPNRGWIHVKHVVSSFMQQIESGDSILRNHISVRWSERVRHELTP